MKKQLHQCVFPSQKHVIKLFRIMKLTLLLTVIAVINLSAATYSQETKLTVNSTSATLGKVFKAIEDQSDYNIFYKDNQINLNKEMNLSMKNATIHEVLDKAFKNTNLSYTVLNKIIVISDKSMAKFSVTGTVVGSNQTPIVGATVMEKGTQNATITDANGRFKLDVKASDAVLVVTFVGYEVAEINLNGSASVNVTLKDKTNILDEVVVVGYGTQKKVNLSGAVSQVTGAVLENRPLVNLGQGLEGVMPNLQVTQSNYAPGQGAAYQIRGFMSITGGNPLILVDGVVQDPNLLNPDDIESVSILKDGASASIYGARAAYGVMLITTKKGKKDQAPTLNISTSTTVSVPANVPEYADSWQYITFMNTSSINAGGSNYFDQRLMDNAKKYYDDPAHNLPVYYDPAIDLNGKYNYCGNTNWAKELYENGGLRQVNASLTGGSEKTKYYASYGYMNQQGLLKSYNDQYTRHNISLSVTTDVLPWLSLATRIKYTSSYEDHPSGGSNGNSGISAYSGQLKNDLRPLMPLRHPDGNWAGQGNFTNPFAVGAEGGHDQRKVNDLWLTGAIDVHPLKDLSFKTDFTYNPYSWNQEGTSRLFTEYWAAPGKSNIYPWVNPNSVTLQNENDYYTAVNSYIDYTKSFSKHNFKILVGYNQEQKNYKTFLAKREGLIDNDLPAINRATGLITVGGSNTLWATQGAFSRLNYNYAEKYFVELNGRYDGSSKFPKNDRFAFFPTFSAAWRISEESFWKGIKPIINEAKFRVSNGTLGNQGVSGNFPYISNYGISSPMSYILGGALPVGVSSGALISPTFTWEKVKQWNFGVDLGFLNNKITTTIDVYNRATIGMLTSGQPLPAVLGVAVPNQNAADLKTYGWEGVVTWKDRINDFNYSVSLNVSDYQSEITKFLNPTGDLGSYYVGRKIGEIWGYQSNGLFKTVDDIAASPSQSKLYGGTWNTGDVKYVDLNGDKTITPGANTLADHGDQSIIGNNTPRYQYGLQINASWRGFDLNMFFQGIAKRDYWFSDYRFFGNQDEWDVIMKGNLDYYTDATPNARLPRPYINGAHGNRNTSTLYLQDASYMRMKQASIGYTIPVRWTKKAAITKARIYFTGQNLFTLTKLNKMFDPENLSLMNYPITKSYSVGVNLTF
jgi:TonB-linked SusC/RagA family outer membrane protein